MFHRTQEMKSFVGSRKQMLFDQLSTSIEQKFCQDNISGEIKKYVADPLGFVMWAYDWENDESLHMVPLQEPWRTKYNCEWGPRGLGLPTL